MVLVRKRLFQDGLQLVLQAPGRVITGSCDTLEQVALKLSTASPPDLFVVGGYGPEQFDELFRGIRRIRARVPTAKWLMLSPRTDSQLLHDALECGVDGLLLEDSPAEVLQLLTKLILLGHSFVPATMARVMSEQCVRLEAKNDAVTQDHSAGRNHDKSLADEALNPAMTAEVNFPAYQESCQTSAQTESDAPPALQRQADLSDRENEILGCLVSGHSNKIIARKLDIA